MKQILKHGLPLLAACAALAATAQAASVQIQVQDEQGKALPDAVVFLESREAKQLAKPLQGAEMAQAGRQFVPKVLVVPTGTSVSFPNRDTVRHHVYSFSPVKKFELKLFAGTPANPVVFDKAGIAALGCNIHDNMVSWVVVLDTPFYASTDGAGLVNLTAVPPGNYRLRVWHTRLPVGAPASDQPLVVVTAEAEALDGWRAQQDRLATLSQNVSHRVFPDLTHDSLIESVNGATAAGDAIVAVVASVRAGTTLDGSTASDR